MNTSEQIKEQYPRMKLDTLEQIMKISDYNKIAKLYGINQYELNNDEYIVNAYFYKNMSILKLILELLAFQSILLTICMFLVFLFARDKICCLHNGILKLFFISHNKADEEKKR